MNPGFLDSLNRSYQQVRCAYADKFRNFNLINTSNSKKPTVQLTAVQVADKIQNLFSTFS